LRGSSGLGLNARHISYLKGEVIEMLVHFLVGCACLIGGALLSFLICVDFGKRIVKLGLIVAVALLVLLTVLGTGPHALALAGVLLGLFYRHGRSSSCSTAASTVATTNATTETGCAGACSGTGCAGSCAGGDCKGACGPDGCPGSGA
jgi:hypothetical protein